MIVRLLKDLPLSESVIIKAGKTPDIDDRYVQELIDNGIAEVISVDLPLNLPGRKKLIAHGINTINQLRQIKDFDEIPGIGEKTEADLVEYIKIFNW